MTDGIWRATYLELGGPYPEQGPGWYATHTSPPAPPETGQKYGLVCSFVGPFESEAAARLYCDAKNPSGASSAPVNAMQEAGRRAALERERRFLDSILGEEEKP
jgi:hypothetical protein